MGMTVVAARRASAPHGGLVFVGGIAALCCGLGLALLAAALLVLLVRAGWPALGTLPASGAAAALRTSVFIAIPALLATTVLSFFAAAAASDHALGGQAGGLLRFSMRFGPAMPSVALGAAIAIAIGTNASIAAIATRHPVAFVSLALVLLNAPVATARFRWVFAAASKAWMTAALASGASPSYAYASIVIPRALPSIGKVVLRLAAQIIGETTLVTIAFAVSGSLQSSAPGATGITTLLWRRLVYSPGAAADAQAASIALVLVALVLLIRVAAYGLAQRYAAVRAQA